MSYKHKNLAAGRWKEMSLLEQMANIGSEVDRALTWKAKKNMAFSQRAIDRALELLDLTLASPHELSFLREVARAREGLVDYFYGANEYSSTEQQWHNYFLPFALALRKNY